MPGASGVLVGCAGSAIGERVTEHPLDRRRAACRRAAAASALSEARHDRRLHADAVGPPSMIRSMRPSRSARTCCGGRRRDVAGLVGRRRDHRPAECLQQVARDRMVRHAHRDRVEPGGRELRHRATSRLGSTRVSGPGQNTPASRFAVASKACEPQRGARVGHMRDQRIEARPALGGIEPRDRRAVGGVGAEAVDRLGRERHQPAVGEHARRRRDRVAVRSSTRVASFNRHGGFRDRFARRYIGHRPRPPSRDRINDLPGAGRRHRLHAQACRRLDSAPSRTGSTATSPRTWSTPCWRRPASLPPRDRAAQRGRRQARHAAARTAPSPCRRAGRRPIRPGRRAAGTGSPARPTWGGQGLPHALNAACIEMWNSASMAFGIGPVLTMGAIEALAGTAPTR